MPFRLPLFIELGSLDVSLRPLVFLQMSLLTEKDTAWNALERTNSLVDPLVHVPVACRREDLATRLTRVLPLFELLVTLLVGLVMAPQCKGLGTKWTGNRPLVADTLPVLMLGHLGPRHPTHMATIPREFISVCLASLSTPVSGQRARGVEARQAHQHACLRSV